MKTYKLYFDALYTVVGGYVHQDIEIEAFGYQQYELLNNQLNLNDIVSIQANNPLEAIKRAYVVVKDEFVTTKCIGYFFYDENNYGYLNVQYQACHIHFADDEIDDELEGMLEELNSEYYDSIA